MSWQYWDESGAHPWTNPTDPLPHGTDLFRQEFLQQFIYAAKERACVLYPMRGTVFPSDIEASLLADPTLVDSSPANPIQRIWSFIDSIMPFAFSSAAIAPPDITGASAPAVWDGASMAAAIGIEYNGGFRPRAYNGEDLPTSSYDLRPLTRGDIVGAWIFEDLRKAFSKLHSMVSVLTQNPAPGLGIKGSISKDGPPFTPPGNLPGPWRYTGAYDSMTDPVVTLGWLPLDEQWDGANWVFNDSSGTQHGLIADARGLLIRYQTSQTHNRHVWTYGPGCFATHTFTWKLFLFSTKLAPLPAPNPVDNIFSDFENIGLVENEYVEIRTGADTGAAYYDAGDYLGDEVIPPDPGFNGPAPPDLTNDTRPTNTLGYTAVEWLVMSMDFVYE